jgi:hypothetical protein
VITIGRMTGIPEATPEPPVKSGFEQLRLACSPKRIELA